jgi:hypothetical protein
MQRTIRLETNSPAMLRLAREFFGRHQYGSSSPQEFRWRIICQPDSRVLSLDPKLVAFSDFGLRYVAFGPRGFLAVDLDEREGVAFLADSFAERPEIFRNHRPLDLMFCMTAPALGLTTLSAGCVGAGERSVLVFGPPNSGKTTACYLAAKHGLEFHADQMVLLDQRSGSLQAWGDFFPAVFRPETQEFHPELKSSTRASSHAGLLFHYLDKATLQARWARSASPVCSVFLGRGTASEPQLNKMTREDAVSRLREYILFQEDEQFEEQIAAALNALASQPAYSLKYDRDPKTAAVCIERLLR